jgi:hypothetical protein
MGCANPTALGSLPPDVPDVADVEARFVQVVCQVNPSVVLIDTDHALGSGVVFDAQGDISLAEIFTLESLMTERRPGTCKDSLVNTHNSLRMAPTNCCPCSVLGTSRP